MATNFHILTVLHDDGERLPIIIDEDRAPIVWANEYMMKVRRSSVAASTLRKELAVLGYFGEFCKQAGIDLMQRLRSGDGFTVDEIASRLFPWMRRNFGAHQGRKVAKQVVGRDTVDFRMMKVWAFIKWQMHGVITRLAVGDVRINHIEVKMKAMDTAVNSLITDVTNSRVEKLALAPHRVKRLLEICYPGHPENPWKKCYQERNYLILVMYLTFGLRRAELLKLKLRHMRMGGLIAEIRLERCPDDPEDTRKNGPEVKTQERVLPCDKFLAQRIQNYITNERKNILGESKSPFLILARSGQPMSLNRVNGIFLQIRKRHPDFADTHPHVCRHTCITRLREIATSQGIEDHRIMMHLRYFSGWATDNDDVYTQAATRREVQGLSMAHQQALFVQLGDVPF